jgi:hypothetical protein
LAWGVVAAYLPKLRHEAQKFLEMARRFKPGVEATADHIIKKSFPSGNSKLTGHAAEDSINLPYRPSK